MRVDAARPAHGSVAVKYYLRAEPHPLVRQVRDLRDYCGHDRANAVNHGIQLLIRETPSMLEEAGPVVGIVVIRALEHLLGIRVDVADTQKHVSNKQDTSQCSYRYRSTRYVFAVDH